MNMTSAPETPILAQDTLTTNPLISVCVANYNGSEYIGQCIRSVRAQERDYEIEIILHDDASTDDSANIIREEFPEVVVLESDVNVGFCISNNRMAAAAKGKFLLLLNNDAVLRPGSLNAFTEFANAQQKPGILGLPQYTLHDGSLVDRGYYFDPFMNPIPVFREGPVEVGFVTGACLWIPNDLWVKIGGFPPWFESVAEDAFLCCAARLLGHTVTVLEGPGFDHWIGRNLGGGKIVQQKLTSSVRRRSLTERNKTWVMIICYPFALLLFVLPLHFTLLSIEAVALLITGTPLSKVKAIYFSLPSSLFRDHALVMRLRRRIQSNRSIRIADYLSTFRALPWKFVMLLRHGMPKLY